MDRRDGQDTVMKLARIVSLTLWALAVYFGAVAAHLDGQSRTPAHEALVTVLLVLAGACAIPAAAAGMVFLSAHDRAIMEEQRRRELEADNQGR